MKSLKMNLRWLLTACATAAVCAMICLAPTARATGGEVSGCAYVDANENLVHDESEQLITGVPVRLARGRRRRAPRPICTASMPSRAFRRANTA